MAWVESHQAIERHPKTFRLMSAMGWDLDMTIGKLHRFWWWCVDYAPDGQLDRFNDDILGTSVGLNGGEESSKFVRAMKQAGWIDSQPFRVHDWWDHIGRFLQVKYKSTPDKWRNIKDLYTTTVQTKVVTTVQSRTTNQPTNQPKPTNQPGVNSSNEPPPVEPSKGFPKSESEAVGVCAVSGVPEDFAVTVWNTANGRGGRDAKDIPIRNWASHLKAAWKYQQERNSKERFNGKNNGKRDGRSPNRNGAHNEGTASQYAGL